MNKHTRSAIFSLICIFTCSTFFIQVETCKCESSGEIRGTKPPPGQCNTEDNSTCCVDGKAYDIYGCSPHVSRRTKANMILTSFDRGGNVGRPSACDNSYHSDDELVVGLSTGWFDKGSRCIKHINIRGNGKNVTAKVVDECNSLVGCDSTHDYKPPCGNNIVSATKGVWLALKVPQSRWGSSLGIHWSDA